MTVRWTRVCALDAVVPDTGVTALVDGVQIAADVVASPVHKPRFELATGRCIDADGAVATHLVRVVDGALEVARG